MPTSAEHQEQQQILKALRNSGDAAKNAQAEPLSGIYHDKEMFLLSRDVYDSAIGKGTPPPGWLRASEHLDKLREAMPQLSGLSDERLKDLLRPEKSGFRAELYLPDSAMKDLGYKPVVTFKGSTGLVQDASVPGGLRETSKEDFLANNLPQSVGMKTDYYDRGMRLATVLKDAGLDFELAGHSLGGGIASAASAVTGMHTTTWNSAGLHPDTAPRFARENRGVTISDTNKTVTAYMVQGEVLNAGLQNNIDRMDVLQRRQLAGVLKATSELMHALPELNSLVKQQIEDKKNGVQIGTPNGIPAAQRAVVNTFIDRLAKGDTVKMVDELPLAAGRMQPPLAAKRFQNPNDPNSAIMDRPQAMSLEDVALLATPVMGALDRAGKMAHLGHRVGEGIAAGGQVAGQVLDGAGDVARDTARIGGDTARTLTQAAGAVAAAQVHQAGSAAAWARDTAAQAEARLDQVQGKAQQQAASAGASVLRGLGDLLPDAAERWVDGQADALQQSGDAAERRNQQEAAEARRAGRVDADAIMASTRIVELDTVRVTGQAAEVPRDAIAGAGRLADAGLDAAGSYTAGVTAEAPSNAARAAGMAALNAQLNPTNPLNFPTLVSAAATYALGGDAGREAKERHGAPTILASLQSRIDAMERQARQGLAQPQTPVPDSPELRIASQSPQERDAYEQTLREANRQGVSTEQAQQVATLAAVQVRAPRLEEAQKPQTTVEPSTERERTAAVETPVSVQPVVPLPQPAATEPESETRTESKTQEAGKLTTQPVEPTASQTATLAEPPLTQVAAVSAIQPAIPATPGPAFQTQAPDTSKVAIPPPETATAQPSVAAAQTVDLKPETPSAVAEPVQTVMPAPTDTQSLRLGAQGQEVEFLQYRLQRAGAQGQDGQPVPQDGRFGPDTDYAVRQFQQANDLPATGVADQALEDALSRAPQVRPSEPKPELPATAAQVIGEAPRLSSTPAETQPATAPAVELSQSADSTAPSQTISEQAIERASPDERQAQTQVISEAQRQGATPDEAQLAATQAVAGLRQTPLQPEAEVQEQAKQTARSTYASPSLGGPGGRTQPQERDDELDQPTARQDQAQTFPTDHPDRDLFLMIQAHLPKDTPDEKTAEVMHDFKLKGRIERADEFHHVTLDGDRAIVYGKTIGFSSETSLTTSAPPLEETLQQTQTLDQKRVQDMQLFQAQQAKIEQEHRENPGPVMKRTIDGPATPTAPPTFSGPANGGGGGGDG